MPWRTIREAPGKKAEGLFPQVRFVYRIVLECNFVPPVFNIYIQLIRQVYSHWMSEQSYRIQSGQCTLNLDMAFFLSIMLSQI